MDLTTTLISQAPLAAGVLFVLWLLLTGRVHTDAEFKRVQKERDEYQQALYTERQAVNETAQAAALTNRLIGAVVNLAASRQGVMPPRPDIPDPEELGL